MTHSNDEPDIDSATTEHFVAWLAAQPQASRADLEALCSEHPEQAPHFRRLWEYQQAARDLLVDLRTSCTADADVVRAVRELALAPSRFTPQREIGRGGMCVVEEIFEPRLGRRLARKVLPITLGDARLSGQELRRLSRFVLEARIASRLRHPAIPQVYDFGLDEQERPFLVLPLVDGASFAAIIGRVHDGDPAWPLGRALQVLVTVCGAISHAHGVGILHRDLKPENIMVGRLGETMVIDWGLAKPLDSSELAPLDAIDAMLDGMRTVDGDVVGTPAYMAPEQARGEAGLTPASDQYQIGAILYVLLSGQRPYEDTNGSTSASAIIASVADGPPTPLHKVAPDTPAELAAICERAMARQPASRYGSVDGLAADLRAFLEGRVVAAYGAGAWVTLRKWVARHRGVTLAALGAVVAIVSTLVAFLVVERGWRRELSTANTLLRAANEQATVRLEALESELYLNDIQGVQAGMRDGHRRSELATLLQRSRPERRGLEWRWLERQLDTSAERYARCGPFSLALAPCQTRFATIDGRRLKLWQIRPARLLAERDLASGALVLAFRPDGRELVVAESEHVTRVSVPSLEAIRTFPAGGHVRSACYAPDGRRLFVAGRWSAAQVFDPDGGHVLATLVLGEGRENALAIDARCRFLAIGGWGGQVRVFDAATYALLHTFSVPAGYGTFVSFTDRGLLQVLTSRGVLARFDPTGGRICDQVMLATGDAAVAQAIDSSDAWHLSSRGAALHLTSLATNRVVATGSAHDAHVTAVQFVPNLQGAISLARDGEARFWHWRDGQMQQRIEVGRFVSYVAVTPDKKRLAIAGLGAGLGVVDLDERAPIRWHSLPAQRHNMLALAPDGERAAVVGPQCPLFLVRLGDGAKQEIKLPHTPAWVDWTPAGIWVAMPAGRALALLDHDGTLLTTREVGFAVTRVASRGVHLAVSGSLGELALLDAERVVWRASGAGPLAALGFACDSRELACAYQSGRVEIRAVDNGSLRHELVGHWRHTNGIQSTSDRWITSSYDRSLRIWRRSDGRELLKVVPDDWSLGNVVVTGDERLIVTGGEGGALHVWRID